jgi:hypothetical protein
MLSVATEVFVAFPQDAGKRVLHPARLLTVRRQMAAIELHEPCDNVPIGTDLWLYYEHHSQFMQQQARITSIMQGDERPTLAIDLRGEPGISEARQCFRVSTRLMELFVEIENENRCPVLDVSLQGLAAIATAAHEAGTIINVAIEFEGQRYFGGCCVQSVLPMRDGRFRYGLHCIDRRLDASGLKRGLGRITERANQRENQSFTSA